MNRKNIERMIPIAMDLLMEKELGILTEDGKLPSNYASYVNSYNPAIRQSGLLQVITFNEKDEKRKKINLLVARILIKAGYFGKTNTNGLVDFVKKASNDYSQKKKKQRLLLEAIVACKLAMMTFPKIIVEDKD